VCHFKLTMKNNELTDVEESSRADEFRNRVRGDLFFRIFAELHSLKGQPRVQIFIAHGFLELLINTIIKAKAKNGKKIVKDHRSFPYATQIMILHENGVLSDDDYKVYDAFRKLRNKAAHEPLFNLTTAELKRLDSKVLDVGKFASVCEELMLRLWNNNKDLLIPVFIPTLLEPRK
jgi:hypothetical protein